MQLKQNPFSPFFYSTFLQWTVELLKTACERPLTAQTPSLHSLVNSNRPQRRWRVRLWSVYGGVCAYFCWLFLRSAPWLDLARSALLRQTSPGGGGGEKHLRSAQECRGIGTWLNPGSTHTHTLTFSTLCWDSTWSLPTKTRHSSACNQTIFLSHHTACADMQ